MPDVCRRERVHSQAASAQNIQDEIARQVGAGRTDDQIRAYFDERFGQQYLLLAVVQRHRRR